METTNHIFCSFFAMKLAKDDATCHVCTMAFGKDWILHKKVSRQMLMLQTRFFMTHDHIKNIHKDQKVTYA